MTASLDEARELGKVVGQPSKCCEAWAVAGTGSSVGLESRVCVGVDDKKQG